MLKNGPMESDEAKLKKGRKQASKALSNARQRCTNKNNKDYGTYGAMGIQVLIGLDDLIAAIGLPPKNASLDRIDPHGHYELGNVRWATKAVQAANKKKSFAGGTLPLHSLVAQSKIILEQEKERPKLTEAWNLVLKAFNYGTLSPEEEAILRANLGLIEPPNKTFRTRKRDLGGMAQTVFSLPSLTFPHGLVEARGPSVAPPDPERACRYLRHGLLYKLHGVEGSFNVPAVVHSAIDNLLEGDSPGLALIGRPTKDDLDGGWFEVWMLAAASRLPLFTRFNLITALFPALTCLEHLAEFGSPHNWDDICHPLLDADLLFIPDFQLDCGPWGYLTPYQGGSFERLLRYRTEAKHKTVVGVQAPAKLTKALQTLLLGGFIVQNIANGTAPQIGIASSPACNGKFVGSGSCNDSADGFEG